VGQDARPDADTTATDRPAYTPPVERWTRELLAEDPGPALYGDEDAYDRWVRKVGKYLRYQINRKLVEARGERVPLEWALEGPPPVPEQYHDRIGDAAEPVLEHWRERFEDSREQREAKQLMMLETRGG